MKILFVPLALLAAFTAHAQTPAPAPTGQTIILKPGQMQVQRNPAANRPDRAPVYPGGETAMGLFFLEHLNYPAAKAAGISGTVLVNATVNEDGSITNPVVAQSLAPECDAEALRVVGLLSGWQPAMRRGHPLPVLVQLPVPFGASGVMHVEQVRRQPARGRHQ